MDHLKKAAKFGTKYVATESGSYNDDKWTYNPKNQTEEGYQDTMKVFHELVKVAKEYNSVILIFDFAVESSIKQIRGQVDYIATVLYQKI